MYVCVHVNKNIYSETYSYVCIECMICTLEECNCALELYAYYWWLREKYCCAFLVEYSFFTGDVKLLIYNPCKILENTNMICTFYRVCTSYTNVCNMYFPLFYSVYKRCPHLHLIHFHIVPANILFARTFH